MTVRRVVRFVDDLDGSAAAETVWFALDGVGYEVDLSAVNAAALRTLLDPYLTAGRGVGRVEAGAVGRVRRALARARDATVAAAWPAAHHAIRPDEQPPTPTQSATTTPPPRAEPAQVRFSDQQIPIRR